MNMSQTWSSLRLLNDLDTPGAGTADAAVLQQALQQWSAQCLQPEGCALVA